MNWKERAKKLKQEVPAVFLALRDPGTPWLAKTLAALTVAYALSPIDLIPDFIPVLGYLDDLVVLPFFVHLTVRRIPKEVWDRSLSQAASLWKDGKPKKWYFAIPIVVFWLLILWIVVKRIWF